MIFISRATSLPNLPRFLWFTVLTTISLQPLSSKSNFSLHSLTLCLLSLRLLGISTFLTGAQSPLTSTLTFSILAQVSMANSQELTTCLTLTHPMVLTPSPLWPLTFLNTSTGSTIMTTSATLVHLTLRETTTMCSSKSSQDSQSLVNGKLTGIKVTTCQLNSTFSKI